MTTAALWLVAALPLARIPFVDDQYQPIRALLAAVALVVLAVDGRAVVMGRRARAAATMVGGAVALTIVSAAIHGFGSALFGVHGRFQGLVLTALLVLAGTTGYLALGARMRSLSYALAGVAAVEGLVIVYQAAIGAQPSGTTGNAVLSAGWLCVATSVAFASALATQGARRVWLALATIVGAIGVGAAGSRGAWVGLVLGVLVVVASHLSPRRAVLGAMVVTLLAAGVVAGGATSLAKADPASLAIGSAASRAQIWRGAAAMVAQSPALGVGPGRFLYVFPRYQSEEHAAIEFPDVRADQAHSQPLQVAAEAGLPASLLLVGAFGLCLFAGLRAVWARDGAALLAVAGLAAYGGQALFGIATVETALLGWLLAGVALRRAEQLDQPKAHAGAQSAPVPASVTLPLIVAACAFVVTSSSVWYLAGDAAYAAGLRSFAAGDMRGAAEDYRVAVRINPLVDVYRVAQADVAMYARGAALDEALRSVTDGLSVERDSYDLMLARARLLGSMGAEPAEVSEAYVDAVGLYPLGIEVRSEAARALAAAGDPTRASSYRRSVESLVSRADGAR